MTVLIFNMFKWFIDDQGMNPLAIYIKSLLG